MPALIFAMRAAIQDLPPTKGPRKKEGDNPDHHLWLHAKAWWVCCSVNPTPQTKERFRRRLQTKCIVTARKRRDEIFRRLSGAGMLGTVRMIPAWKFAARGARKGPMGLEYAEAIVADVIARVPEEFPSPVVGSGGGNVCCSCIALPAGFHGGGRQGFDFHHES
ncbi:MAG: hypothetical protein JWM35_1270 [Verrucomicrobia bacterium]|nr:hypothetical protein [Verrucomicrobiota bacterium]